MSSDNAQSAVTYTSISSNLDGPSWDILLINAGEFLEMDPYEEIAQQGKVHPLSPAYIPDPMELDKHVPVHVSDPEHSEYHVLSDDDIRVEDDDKDPEEDPEEYPSKEHEPEDYNEDPEEDPNEEHEPEDSDEREPLEEDETAVTPPPPRHHGARIYVRPQTPMTASTQALIDTIAVGSSPFPLPPTSLAYDQAQLGRRAAMIRMRDDILEEDMPPQRRFVLTAPPPRCDVVESSAARAPRSQYNFVDTVEAGHGLVRSPGHNAWTIARAADRVENIGYVRALHASEQRMMTSIEEVNLRRQSAEDLAVTQMMHIHTLEARAYTDTVKDGTLKKKMTEKYCPKGEIKKLETELWNLRVNGNDVATYTQRFQELALMCTKFLVDETKKVDKYISGLPDYIHGNVMSARSKTLDETVELANDLMDQKLRTYAERQNENKRKTDNNQQQQPHKKQNVARAHTTSGTGIGSMLKGVTTFIACSSLLSFVVIVVVGTGPTIRGCMTIPLAFSTLRCTLPHVMVIVLGAQ
nr:reverse transcriptase domain-containing protein [Tanacetum cinerariifolium]